MTTYTRRRLLATSAFLIAMGALPAFSQTAVPSQQLRIVVPFPPGGSNDAIARILAAEMGPDLGQTIIVENRVGASGAVGAASVARGAPDGATILFASVSAAIYQSTVKAPLFHLDRDFEPVSLTTNCEFTLAINPKVPATSFPEFLRYARERGSEVFYGSAGIGTSTHLAAEMFNMLAGTRMTHVPYKGNGPMVIGLVGGEVHAGFDTVSGTKAYADSGKLRVLAVSGATRSPLMPDVPTMQEAGLAGFDIVLWHGLFLPKGTPQPIVARWNAAIVKALAVPSVKKRMADLGFNVVASTPAKLKSTVDSEVARWAGVIKSAGIKPE
jgi:tripartite-type tricarboxylate transporter receptor subunit TctC